MTKMVRLASLYPLYNVDGRFGCLFLISTVWYGFFRLGVTLICGGVGNLGTFKEVQYFLGHFYKN